METNETAKAKWLNTELGSDTEWKVDEVGQCGRCEAYELYEYLSHVDGNGDGWCPMCRGKA